MRSSLFVIPTLLSLVLSLGCSEQGASDRSFEITFDPCVATRVVPADSTTAEQLTSVGTALAMWNEVAGTRLTLEPTEGALEIPIEFEEAASAFYGMYEDEHGSVFINSRLADPEAAITIAHELGHAFGLFHVREAEARCVMNPGNLEIGPTTEDAVRLAALWGACPQATP